nr:alkylglycerol monooxygenase-like [Penaeus vannamei]
MSSFVEQVGSFFYIINPNTTTFEHVEEVPNYVNDAVPVFISFLVLELLVGFATGKKIARFNDGITSLGHGLVYEACKLVTRSFELWGYSWLYEYRLIDLDWSSPVTWWVAAIGVDFAYYWTHRAAHEVDFMWAAHQVHHSSEDYTLPTGLRLSMFQRLTYFGFYQPLALLGLPVTSVMVHLGLNYLFQFWVHNEAVRKMGPLEWVFNTPSHHRVHHGANKWCLDKNYGSLLIVWDRLFGTFQEERDDEEIVYGLVEQPQFLNGVWHELFYLEKIYEKARGMSSWSDSLRAVFYGPGWVPGAPRLGDPDAFPDVKAPRAKYDPQMPVWFMVYTALHFTLAFGAQQIMLVHLKVSPWHTAALFLAFILLTMGVLGSMFDGWRWAPLLEAARCAAFLLYSRATPITSSPQLDAALYFLFSMSTFFWTVLSLRTLRAPLKIVKED